MNVSLNDLIFDTLAVYRSVYLPSIGSLFVIRTASVVHPRTKKLLPPRLVVEFRRDTLGGNLFEECSAEMSQQIESSYDQWVASITSSVEQETIYTIKRVGVLRCFDSGNALFEMDEELSDLLNPLQDDPSQEQLLPIVPPPLPGTPPPPKAPSVLALPQPPSSPSLSSHKKIESRYKKHYVTWRNIAIVLFVVLMFLLGLLLWNPSTPEISESQIVRDTVVVIDNKLLAKPQIDSVEVLKPYHIIAGSFRLKEKAESFIEQKKIDYPEAVLLFDHKKNMYLLSIMSFDDRTQAQKQLNKLPILYYPNSYWIYVQSPK